MATGAFLRERALGVLGGVAWVRGDYETAIRLYQQALDIRVAIDDTWGIGISLSNIGSAYGMLGEHAQALDYFQRALAVNRTIGRRRGDRLHLERRHGV